MWLTDLAIKLRNSKLIDMGFCRNNWLWFHLFSALILFKALIAMGAAMITTAIIISVIAILWEIVEFFVENGGKWENVIQNYGSLEKWKWDTIGDVLGVIIVIAISMIRL